MKKSLLISTLISFASLLAFGGCVAAIGNGQQPRSNATLGQQLIDLQKARDGGAMTEAEYQAQRAKFLGEK